MPTAPPAAVSPAALIAAALLFSALWASAFIAGRIALGYCDPVSLLLVRFAVAGLLMAGGLIVAGKGGRLLDPPMLVAGLGLGLFNNALYLGLTFTGLASVSPPLVVLIVSTAPFVTLAINRATGGGGSVTEVVGALIGFAGVALVVSSRLDGAEASATGLVLVALGTIAFALGTLYYRHRATHLDPLALNTVQNLAGALMLLPIATDPLGPVAALAEPRFFWAFAHLVLGVSIAAFLIWLALVRRIGAPRATAIHLLNPVFGVGLSALILGTEVRAADLAGALAVIAGLALINGKTMGRPSLFAGLRVGLARYAGRLIAIRARPCPRSSSSEP